VHQTGGLADTVRDGRTGFQFRSLTVEGLMGAVTRAFRVFNTRSALSKMRLNAMRQDFSWSESAAAYGSLYIRGIGNR